MLTIATTVKKKTPGRRLLENINAKKNYSYKHQQKVLTKSCPEKSYLLQNSVGFTLIFDIVSITIHTLFGGKSEILLKSILLLYTYLGVQFHLVYGFYIYIL